MAQRATSLDPVEWGAATEAARAKREDTAREVAAVIAQQVAELLIEGDIMGGRSLAAIRLQQVAAAERRGDRVVLRGALIDASAAFAQWAAGLDFRVPPVNGNGAAPDDVT